MKFNYVLILAAMLMAMPACERKGPGEKLGEKVDDALDRRPAEGIRDAAEDIKDDIKDKTN